MRPTPAYKDIVYTESVIVNLLIMMRQIDQSKDDRITIKDPISIVMSGLRTISVPINPIIKAVILRILIISLRNKTENTNPSSVLDGNIDQFIEEGIKNKKWKK